MYTYNPYFLKGIEYSMSVTNFDKKRGNEVLAPALEDTLNISAMIDKFPQNVLYGPVSYKGLDI